MMLAASELADTVTEVVLDPYCALMWKSGTNIAPCLRRRGQEYFYTTLANATNAMNNAMHHASLFIRFGQQSIVSQWPANNIIHHTSIMVSNMWLGVMRALSRSAEQTIDVLSSGLSAVSSQCVDRVLTVTTRMIR